MLVYLAIASVILTIKAITGIGSLPGTLLPVKSNFIGHPVSERRSPWASAMPSHAKINVHVADNLLKRRSKELARELDDEIDGKKIARRKRELVRELDDEIDEEKTARRNKLERASLVKDAIEKEREAANERELAEKLELANEPGNDDFRSKIKKRLRAELGIEDIIESEIKNAAISWGSKVKRT